MPKFAVSCLAIVLLELVSCRPETQPVTSEESARQAAVGVWINHEPMRSLVELRVGWNRLVLAENGTCFCYHGRPHSENWGRADKGTWKIVSGKSRRTGEEYYGIKCQCGSFPPYPFLDGYLAFIDNQTANLSDTDDTVLMVLRKGEVFPFSGMERDPDELY